MQLGGAPPQLFDQARDGVVDIVWTLPGYTAGRFPRLEVFELPFVATRSGRRQLEGGAGVRGRACRRTSLSEVHLLLRLGATTTGVIHAKQADPQAWRTCKGGSSASRPGSPARR